MRHQSGLTGRATGSLTTTASFGRLENQETGFAQWGAAKFGPTVQPPRATALASAASCFTRDYPLPW